MAMTKNVSWMAQAFFLPPFRMNLVTLEYPTSHARKKQTNQKEKNNTKIVMMKKVVLPEAVKM